MSDSISEIKIRVCIMVEPDDGLYHAYCPELKGVHVSGDTEIEAVENCCRAVDLYIKSILVHGDPLPIGCVESREEQPSLPLSWLANVLHCGRFRSRNSANSQVRELSIAA